MIVTLEVSAFVSPCRTAITRYVPGVLPAVYIPPDVIDPPVAVQFTAMLLLEPSLFFRQPKTAVRRLARDSIEAGVT